MKKLLVSLCLAMMICGAAFADRAADMRAAVYYNQPDKVLTYLAQGYDINSQTGEGFTPLMVAAEQDMEDMVKLLLEHGANPSLKSDSGKKAIDYTYSRTIKKMLAEAEGIEFSPVKKATPAKATTPKATKPKTTTAPAKPLDHCKKMYGMSYKLCSTSDYSCKIKAANDYKKCQKTGTWY